jgi:hypothetical protein
MIKYRVSNFNDIFGSTYCIFRSEIDGFWHLSDRISINQIKPDEAIEKLATILVDVPAFELRSSGSKYIKDSLKQKFGIDARTVEPEPLDTIVEMIRSGKLTAERRIIQDIQDDINDPQKLETSRLLKTVCVAFAFVQETYPSSFGGDPIEPDSGAGWGRLLENTTMI